MFAAVKMLRQATRIIAKQQQMIAALRRDNLATELAYMRIGRDLIEQFLIALDQPENHDVYRRRLERGLAFYRDEIAVREEHV